MYHFFILISDEQLFFSAMNAEGTVVSCGDVGQVVIEDSPLHFGVAKIVEVEGCLRATGSVIGAEDIMITAPVLKVAPSSKIVSKQVRKKLLAQKKKQFEFSIMRAKVSQHYRLQTRRANLGRMLRQEVQSALKSKLHRRPVLLGLCVIETDLSIFGLDYFNKRKVVYSYKNNNLSELDLLLGNKWDATSKEGIISYVTEVIVHLSKDDLLHAIIFTTVSWGSLEENYRVNFHKSMAST